MKISVLKSILWRACAVLLTALMLLAACSKDPSKPEHTESFETTESIVETEPSKPEETLPPETEASETGETMTDAPSPAAFEPTPGKVLCELSTGQMQEGEELSQEETAALLEYFRLRGEELTDPLNAENALFDSTVRLSEELREHYMQRSAACLAALYRIEADYEKVTIYLSIQSLKEEGGERFVTLQEEVEVHYRYKDHKSTDRMSWVIPHLVTLSTDEPPVLLADDYDEELILPEDPEITEGAMKKAYEAYWTNHPVTDQMISEARTQVLQYLESRLRSAIQSGTYGMAGFKEEDIPKILEGALFQYDPAVNEEWVLTGLKLQPYRLPFRKYQAVFSVIFDLSVEDPATKKTFHPFTPLYYRVFFVLTHGSWEYMDIHDNIYFD